MVTLVFSACWFLRRCQPRPRYTFNRVGIVGSALRRTHPAGAIGFPCPSDTGRFGPRFFDNSPSSLARRIGYRHLAIIKVMSSDCS